MYTTNGLNKTFKLSSIAIAFGLAMSSISTTHATPGNSNVATSSINMFSNGTLTTSSQEVKTGVYSAPPLGGGGTIVEVAPESSPPPLGGGGTIVEVAPEPTEKNTEMSLISEIGIYSENIYAANTLFNHTLHDRIGEAHFVNSINDIEPSGSLWMRNIGGHTRNNDESGQLKTQSNRYVVQLGSDIVQWMDNNRQINLGVMGGYANQKSNSRNGRSNSHAEGSLSGYSIGMYLTWLQTNQTIEGGFIDTWILYNWFNNTVKSHNSGAGKYDSTGFTASAEVGYTWKLLALSERNSVYIQPKAQVIWMDVKADSTVDNNGTYIQGYGDGNIQSKVGVKILGHGKNSIDDNTVKVFQPFVEASWIHNTTNFGSSFNGRNVDFAGINNIAELKTGIESKLTTNLSLWGNIAQKIGDSGFSDTSAMLGGKVSF